jgi:hypothetical protein
MSVISLRWNKGKKVVFNFDHWRFKLTLNCSHGSKASLERQSKRQRKTLKASLGYRANTMKNSTCLDEDVTRLFVQYDQFSIREFLPGKPY